MNQRDRSRNDRIVHVVAGVITDARDRILLARRTEGRDLAGLWEFPGGKVDPGETPEQALVRELREELGIDAKPGERLIMVPQQYPDKRLLLDVRHIAAWSGTIKGLDGQALAWVPPHKLASYAMPAADRPVVAALRMPDRYLVTPEPGDDDVTWLSMLQRSLEAGIRCVQLRAPNTDPTRWRRLVEQAVKKCRKADADVLLNHDIEFANALGIGVHLRASQLATLSHRPLPKTALVMASCHDLTELQAAETLCCDAVVLGPVLVTETHPGHTGIGWQSFSELREHISLPIYAIGGMQAQHIAQARLCGAQGIAAVRGLWG